MFRVGMKVVKVSKGSDPIPAGVKPVWPVIGGVYVVEAVQSSSRWPGEFSIRLAGLPFWHRAIRFRPIVSRKTSIAVFEAMLKKVPATAAPRQTPIPAERGGVS